MIPIQDRYGNDMDIQLLNTPSLKNKRNNLSDLILSKCNILKINCLKQVDDNNNESEFVIARSVQIRFPAFFFNRVLQPEQLFSLHYRLPFDLWQQSK